MGRLPLKDMVCATVGLALSWFFFPPGAMSCFFPGMVETRFYHIWHEALLVILMVVGLVTVFLHARIERMWGFWRWGALAVVEVSTAVGYALLLLSGVLEGAPLLVVALAALPLLTCGYTLLVVMWACTLSQFEPFQAVRCVVASVVVYAVLSLLQLGTEAAGVIGCVLTTCLSGFLWFAVRPAPRSGGDRIKGGHASHGGSPSLVGIVRQLPLVQLGLVALFLVGGRITVGLFFDYFKDSFPAELFARNIVTALVMGFVLVRLRRAGDPWRQAYSAWMPVALVLLFGTLLELALRGTTAALGCGIINGMLRCFECIAYIMLIQFVQERAASPVLVFGLWLVVLKAFPVLVQRCLTAPLAQLFGLSPDMFAVPLIFIVMVLISGTLVLLNRRDAPKPMVPVDDLGAARETGEFEALCAAAGLTPRELDIVHLIARGNSQKRTAELLGLSYSTVQSYTKKIYAKMGVHSRQELVDLAERVPDHRI